MALKWPQLYHMAESASVSSDLMALYKCCYYYKGIAVPIFKQTNSQLLKIYDFFFTDLIV